MPSPAADPNQPAVADPNQPAVADPKRLVVTDPERIRALAHPLRLALLDLLDDEGEATATECAARTGESVASCSFHLRMLAKYGYLERGERRGREKPWRSTTRNRELRPDFDDPAAVLAIATVAELLFLRELERFRAFVTHMADEPAEWRDGATFARSDFWVTADELDELRRQVESLTERFAGRWTNPELRPPGSRPAHLVAVLNPDPQRPRRRP